MAKAKEETSVFNVNKVRELIELMEEHDLNEVDLKQSDQRIRLKRGGEMVAAAPIAQPPAPVAAASPVAAAAVAPAAPAADETTDMILSPTIGTYYSRPKPDAEDFIKVGDKVTPDTIVCLVEAMKMFNEIPAGVSGTIVEILVNSEDAVHVDMPLFRISKN
jgi:acetyl-CoA carboxylase biotin carboxyl carrier protein